MNVAALHNPPIKLYSLASTFLNIFSSKSVVLRVPSDLKKACDVV